MAKRDKTILIRISEDEQAALKHRASTAGKSVSAYLRELGLGGERPVQSEAREVVRAAPAVKAQPVHRTIAVEVEPDLAERRERRARQLSAKMPLRNAKQLAAREITE